MSTVSPFVLPGTSPSRVMRHADASQLQCRTDSRFGFEVNECLILEDPATLSVEYEFTVCGPNYGFAPMGRLCRGRIMVPITSLKKVEISWERMEDLIWEQFWDGVRRYLVRPPLGFCVVWYERLF